MTARIEWLDERGRALPAPRMTDWVAKKGAVRERFRGLRNVGDRKLHGLIIFAKEETTTRATFRRRGLRRRFFPKLRLGDLLPGKRVQFWIREELTGQEGPSSEIVVEET